MITKLDTAIYETFVRMSQPWINNISEVDFHGSNGNVIIGASPAHERYTETRLSKAAEDGMFTGIKKNNVNMIPNFSEDKEWPEVLPAIFPRLLINGSQGIGLAHSQSWALWNLREITNIIVNYLETGKLNTEKVYPDFPSGGVLINKKDIPQIIKTGKGKIILRGRATVKDNIISIKELPYQVYVEPFIDSVVKLISNEELPEIVDIFNKSDREKLLIEIKCSKNARYVLMKLFSMTDLQKTYQVNQNALLDKTPTLFNFKKYIDTYVEHNINCIVRETEYDLTRAKKRKEIVEGLIKATIYIDDIIALIKESIDMEAARERLKAKFNFTDLQTKAIIEMKLGKLAKLEGRELKKELEQLKIKIEMCERILKSEYLQKKELIKRLTDFTNKYGQKRKTKVMQLENDEIKLTEDKINENITPEEVVVVITKDNYIKKIPKSKFVKKRKLAEGEKLKGDMIRRTYLTNNLDTLVVFTNRGTVHYVSVTNIPEGNNNSKGVPIDRVSKIPIGDTIEACYPFSKKEEYKYVLFYTKNGAVKKTALKEFENIRRPEAFIGTHLRVNDKLIGVIPIKTGDENILLITEKGQGITFNISEIPTTSKSAFGVKGIKLAEDDNVIGCIVFDEKDGFENKYIGLFRDDGLGKRVPLEEAYKFRQKRNGKGIIYYKRPEDVKVVSVCSVDKDDELLVIGKEQVTRVKADEITIAKDRLVGKGSMVQKTNGNSIISVIKV